MRNLEGGVLKIDFLKIVSFSLSGHYDLPKKMSFRPIFISNQNARW